MTEKITKESLYEQTKAAYGFVPNLIKGIAQHNPAVGAAYLAMGSALARGVLTAAEQQVVMLTVSAFNECHYCTAVHRTVAASMGIPQAELDAIDAKHAPSEARLKALTSATTAILAERGRLTDATRGKLGIPAGEVLEIIGIIGMKTISNYINFMERTEIDEPFRPQATKRVPTGG